MPVALPSPPDVTMKNDPQTLPDDLDTGATWPPVENNRVNPITLCFKTMHFQNPFSWCHPNRTGSNAFFSHLVGCIYFFSVSLPSFSGYFCAYCKAETAVLGDGTDHQILTQATNVQETNLKIHEYESRQLNVCFSICPNTEFSCSPRLTFIFIYFTYCYFILFQASSLKQHTS